LNTDATQVPTAVGGGSGTEAEAEAAHPEYAAPAAPTDVDDPTAAPSAAVDNPATVPAAERPSAEPASRIVVATAEADAPPIASVDADAVIDVVAAAAQPGAGDSAPTTLAQVEGAIQPDEPAAAVPVPTSPLLDPDGPSATPEAWPSNLWAKIEPQARGSVSVPAAVPNPFHAVAEAVTAGSATPALTWSGLSDPIRLPRLPIDLPSGIPPPAVPTGVPLSSTTLFDSGQSGPSAAVLSLLSSTLALATWRVPSVDRLRLPAGIAQAVLVPPG
jgi:hypothetical protein